MNESQGLRQSSRVALAALAVLLLIALIWFKEKVFFADASYVLFDIANYKNFDIQFNRYGSFITQLVPWVGFKLHLPLSALIIGYAISFHVFYLTVAAILVYRYKQYGLAILMALFYCLFVSDSFFWISEIPQGIGWMFLLFGTTLHSGYKNRSIGWVIIPFLVLAFLALFTHFVIIMPVVFLWVYLISGKTSWPWSKRDTIVLSCLLAAVIGLKFFIALAGPASGDAPHLHGVTHVSFKDIFLSFSTPVVAMFSSRCCSIYWVGILVFLAGIYALFSSGQKKLAAWVIISTIGYFIIMGLTYGDEDEHLQLFHIESEWMSICIIIAAPFVFDFLPRRKPFIAVSLLAAVFLVRVVYIGNTLPAFRWRIHFQERVLGQMKKKGINKLAMYREYSIGPKYKVDWAAGYESTLISAMNGGVPQRTFIFIDRDNNQAVLQKIADPKCVYLWDAISLARLNSDYFAFDTTHPYQVMTYDDLMK